MIVHVYYINLLTQKHIHIYTLYLLHTHSNKQGHRRIRRHKHENICACHVIFLFNTHTPHYPMHHAKIINGQPRSGALWECCSVLQSVAVCCSELQCTEACRELVPKWCKAFPPDHLDLEEMNQPTRMSK